MTSCKLMSKALLSLAAAVPLTLAAPAPVADVTSPNAPAHFNNHAAAVVINHHNKGPGDHSENILNMESGGGSLDSYFINFYSVPTTEQTLAMCNITVSNNTPPFTQLVSQVPSWGGIWGKASSSIGFVGPFNGYEMGQKCTYNGAVGPFGTLNCTMSMTHNPTGVQCGPVSQDLKNNPTHCDHSGGSSDDYTPIAFCQWASY